MKAIALALSMAVMVASLLKAERIAGTFEPRVPPITIDEAIKQLNRHLQERNGPDHFIDEAEFVRDGKASYWKIGTRRTEVETGHAFYSVEPDGTVKLHSVVKDG